MDNSSHLTITIADHFTYKSVGVDGRSDTLKNTIMHDGISDTFKAIHQHGIEKLVNELVINDVKAVNPRSHLGNATPIVFS